VHYSTQVTVLCKPTVQSYTRQNKKIVLNFLSTLNSLAPNDIYICRAVSPLNGRTAIKVDGGGDLIPVRKIKFRCQRVNKNICRIIGFYFLGKQLLGYVKLPANRQVLVNTIGLDGGEWGWSWQLTVNMNCNMLLVLGCLSLISV